MIQFEPASSTAHLSLGYFSNRPVAIIWVKAAITSTARNANMKTPSAPVPLRAHEENSHVLARHHVEGDRHGEIRDLRPEGIEGGVVERLAAPRGAIGRQIHADAAVPARALDLLDGALRVSSVMCAIG